MSVVGGESYFAALDHFPVRGPWEIVRHRWRLHG